MKSSALEIKVNVHDNNDNYKKLLTVPSLYIFIKHGEYSVVRNI